MLQTIWHQVNHGQEIYVVGKILPDETVKGGTGWGAEFAKLCNKPLFVFDQERDGWFRWSRRGLRARQGSGRSATPTSAAPARASSPRTARPPSTRLFERTFR